MLDILTGQDSACLISFGDCLSRTMSVVETSYLATWSMYTFTTV